jgi:DNA-binding transcriptional regulator YhcF (GntR family)
MPIYNLGPRAQHVYAALRDRIVRGDLEAGTKLPPHTELAETYGVAPLTMRHVLARLEEEGFVSREQGRGTFIRSQVPPAVLIAGSDVAVSALLGEYVKRAGFRPVAVASAPEGLAQLVDDATVALVYSDVHLPDKETGGNFIRAVRRRWPELPLVALTGNVEDLAGLHGTQEWPVLHLSKPFWPHQIQETLRLALRQ